MIKFNDFHYSYHKGSPLYTDLNIEFTNGKIYGLFGKNGAGKSTLLKNICGLNRPTAGNVIVNGYTPHERKPAFLQDVFIIPEELYTPPLSQYNFIKTYGAFYPKFSFDHLCENLDKLGVPESNALHKMSYGQKKKFMIAFALACNTSIVIMDEPTNGLDIPSKSLYRNFISSSITKDKLFIISTHQVKDLDDILDHIVIVDQGKLVLDAAIDEISKKITFEFINHELKDKSDLIISEQVTGGHAVMLRNVNNKNTRINLEQLFNASVMKTDEITSLFDHKK